MNPLQTFYSNEVQREAVKAFMVECLREISADYALEGKETKGFKEAHECIDRLFDTLRAKYGIINKTLNNNSR